jgi:hypothetical protein
MDMRIAAAAAGGLAAVAANIALHSVERRAFAGFPAPCASSAPANGHTPNELLDELSTDESPSCIHGSTTDVSHARRTVCTHDAAPHDTGW